MTCPRWLSLFLAWTLLLQSLAPALASSHLVRRSAPMQGAPAIRHASHENHDFLVDTSQPYAEVIQEKTWRSDGAGNSICDAPVVDRYDIGLDRLRVFRYQLTANGPPTALYTNWLLFDGLGSTRMVLGDSGSVVDEFGYSDAFGIPYRVTANGGGRDVAGPGFFLNGQQWDGGSSWGRSYWSGTPAFNSGEGLYFNRARYYQPELGRFAGEDAYQGDYYDPTTLHRFQYAQNNVVNYTDPDGNETLTGQLNTLGIGIYVSGIKTDADMRIYHGLKDGYLTAQKLLVGNFYSRHWLTSHQSVQISSWVLLTGN